MLFYSDMRILRTKKTDIFCQHVALITTKNLTDYMSQSKLTNVLKKVYTNLIINLWVECKRHFGLHEYMNL